MTEQMIPYDEFMHRLNLKIIAGMTLKDAIKFHLRGKDEELKNSIDYQVLLATIKSNPDNYAHRYLDDMLSLAYFMNRRNLNN